MKTQATPAALAFLLAALPGTATAATLITGGSEVATGTANSGNFSTGIDFTSTIVQGISALGFWDSGADGLVSSHPVGLWETSTQTLLASVTISSADPLDTSLTVEGGQWRYGTLGAIVTLTAGTTYTLAAYIPTTMTTADSLYLNYPTVTTAPSVTLVDQRRAIAATGLVFPTTMSAGGTVYRGMINARFVAIPEPSALLLGALGSLALRRRRRA